ncbi:hypothetical protein WAI453_002429 [Rhynchosporium graminicola]
MARLRAAKESKRGRRIDIRMRNNRSVRQSQTILTFSSAMSLQPRVRAASRQRRRSWKIHKDGEEGTLSL